MSSDISHAASVTSFIMAMVDASLPDFSLIDLSPLSGSAPTFSRADLSSGWKTTMTATIPTWKRFCIMNCIARISSMSDRSSMRRSIRSPAASFPARLSRMNL